MSLAALGLALLATFVVSAIAFIGIFFISIKDETLNKFLLALVALSSGVLFGGAFFHLFPEAIESVGEDVLPISVALLSAIVLFFVLEKFVSWRHCHKGKCDVHSFTYMNLIGDGIHNFIDGLVIVVAFLTSTNLGFIVTITILFHEIPQEIADFSVLIYGGFKKAKALFFNFASALTAVAGAIVGFLISSGIGQFTTFLLPFAAGGFIYVAGSDLIPELRQKTELSSSIVQTVMIMLGIFLMWLLLFLE
ncbi:MAG: ZIP family metal transporter [Promethearchaeota archaeon]